MNFSRAITGLSPKVTVTLLILGCVVAAIWLTATADLLIIHLLEWSAVR
jgi:hypothetical protein